jgi:lipopolysaccharide transport system ATP-binding protein
MKPVIEINGLGKKYLIRKTERYLALRDAITDSVKNIFRKRSESKEDFWALQDINLKIEQGERIGIIGKNGAGKSTLLKILSRITWPTTGEAIIRGRLASLLEVGTGFHPELTGRENIYLNGSILGLKKIEIDKQFDAIVDFSGVETFLETPLKNYSSGMQLRLAFAVAAHLEPEVLLIDEVLAVGDMEFQKKCLGKMEEVSKQHGRTILFVSHNMSFISSLCIKGILLDKGKIIESGTVNKVISGYTTHIANHSSYQTWKENERPGNDIVKLCSLKVIDSSLCTKEVFKVTQDIGIEMVYEVLKDDEILWLGHNIYNEYGVNIFDTHSVSTDYYKQPHFKGFYSSIVWIPGNFLNTGNFFISSAIFNHLKNIIHFHQHDSLMFSVYEIFDEETARGLSGGDFPGVVRPLLKWQIKKI